MRMRSHSLCDHVLDRLEAKPVQGLGRGFQLIDLVRVKA